MLVGVLVQRLLLTAGALRYRFFAPRFCRFKSTVTSELGELTAYFVANGEGLEQERVRRWEATEIARPR